MYGDTYFYQCGWEFNVTFTKGREVSEMDADTYKPECDTLLLFIEASVSLML